MLTNLSIEKKLEILDTILNLISNGIIIIDRNCVITGYNDCVKKMFNLNKDDIFKGSISDYIPKVLYEKIGFFENFESEFYFHKLDKYIFVKCNFIEDEYAVILLQDITPEKSALMELKVVKESENDIKNLLEASYDGIYITDCNGLTLYVNKSHERISGIKASDLIGKYMNEIVHEGLVSKFITNNVVNIKAPVTIEQTLANSKKVIITGSPIFGKDGNVKKVITNVRDITELIKLQKELKDTKVITEKLKQDLFNETDNKEIVCESKEFLNTLTLAKQVSKKDVTVLITGETGVGKEVVAKYIYLNSKRKNNTYIKINCGSIPLNLLESELFGYVEGAFTGASRKGKTGLFEVANLGTIFLDEIGELPLNLQSSLLRVLQEGEIIKIGDTKSTKVDVRVIAATNRDLEVMVEEGSFRNDLFYRLNVVGIEVPPLRNRKEDIPHLAEMYIRKFNKKYNDNKILTSNFIDHLIKNEWSGNVRELENYILKQFIITDGDIIDVPNIYYNDTEIGNIKINGILPLKYAVNEVERFLLKKALEIGKTTYKAAEILEISQPTFCRKYNEITKLTNHN